MIICKNITGQIENISQDTVLYECEIIEKKVLSKNAYELFINAKCPEFAAKGRLISYKSSNCKGQIKIRVGRKYKLYLSKYFERQKYAFPCNWLYPILFLDTIVKVSIEHKYPLLWVSSNLNGLYYTFPNKPPRIDSILDFKTISLYEFLNHFTNIISYDNNESAFLKMVDSNKLYKSLNKLHIPCNINVDKSNLYSFLKDSLYIRNNKLDSIRYFNYNDKGVFYPLSIDDCENGMKLNILMAKGSIITTRIKWKTSKDFLPRSAIVSIEWNDEIFKIIGFDYIIY